MRPVDQPVEVPILYINIITLDLKLYIFCHTFHQMVFTKIILTYSICYINIFQIIGHNPVRLCDLNIFV